jgi:anti-sigma-K factor RskA
MIDERHEELASLYALDLLEGVERSAFESSLAADPALRALVDELRESTAALAHTAPNAEPPAELRARVLASVPEAKIEQAKSNVIAFPTLVAWAAAACFALLAGFLGQRYLALRSDAVLLREEKTIAELAAKSARNENEAAQILARRQLESLTQQVATAARQLTDLQQRASSAESRLADTALQLAAAQKQAADASTQIAQLASRLDAAARSTNDARTHADELGAALASAQTRIASLQRDLQTQGDLANFKITTLASLLKNSPQAVAVAVWNPATHEGMLKVDKLPALAADKDYQLWVVDPQYPNPVDGGVFTVDPASGVANVKFHGNQPVAAIAAFAVTLERKGGVPKAEGPFVLLGK